MNVPPDVIEVLRKRVRKAEHDLEFFPEVEAVACRRPRVSGLPRLASRVLQARYFLVAFFAAGLAMASSTAFRLIAACVRAPS